MEKLLTVENSAIMICSLLAFALGAVLFFKPNKPLYAAIVVMGLGCAMLGRLFQCILLLTGGSLTDNFQIGILGVAGMFGFFFAANLIAPDAFGGAEKKLSKKQRKQQGSLKYDSIAYFAPLAIVGLYVMIALSSAVLPIKIAYGFTAFIIAAACYSHLHRAITPNRENGGIGRLRLYNALALLLGIACMLEMAALAFGNKALLIAAGAAICVLMLAIVPVINRGVGK